MHTDITSFSKSPQQENLTSSGGTVVAFDRSNRPEEKEEYTAAIRMWCVDRSLSNALSRAEIGALSRPNRIDAQRKALILGISHYLRNHPRSDVALGVYLITTLLSDNEKGCCSVSQPTMAKLFDRSVSSIADAQRRLREENLIVTARGRYAGSFPVIPRAVTQSYNHMTWLIEAINAQDGAVNLPAPPDDCQSTGPTGCMNQSTGPTGGLKAVNHPVEPVSIIRPDAIQLLTSNSSTVNRAASLVAAGIAGAMSALPAAAEPPVPPAIVRPMTTLAAMTDRMTEVAGAALANPAAHAGLLTFSDLQNWLKNGCDFEGDILPAIRARCARAAPGSIKSWRYFDEAVFREKANRERPAPVVTQSPRWQKPLTRAQMIEAGIKPDDMPENVWQRLQSDIAKAKSSPC